jgi:hypothetical protein
MPRPEPQYGSHDAHHFQGPVERCAVRFQSLR